MGALSPWHLILVLLVALLVLGPGKLPEAGAAIGKAVREFRDAMEGHEEAAAWGSGPTASSQPVAQPSAPAQATPSATAPPTAAPAVPTVQTAPAPTQATSSQEPFPPQV